MCMYYICWCLNLEKAFSLEKDHQISNLKINVFINTFCSFIHLPFIYSSFDLSFFVHLTLGWSILFPWFDCLDPFPFEIATQIIQLVGRVDKKCLEGYSTPSSPSSSWKAGVKMIIALVVYVFQHLMHSIMYLYIWVLPSHTILPSHFFPSLVSFKDFWGS